MTENNWVSKVHSVRKEVRDGENVPDLGSGRARHISTEEDRRFLEVRNLTRKGAEILQNSANVGSLNNRGSPTNTTGFRRFAECLMHSAKATLPSAKPLPSAALCKAFAECSTRQKASGKKSIGK